MASWNRRPRRDLLDTSFFFFAWVSEALASWTPPFFFSCQGARRPWPPDLVSPGGEDGGEGASAS